MSNTLTWSEMEKNRLEALAERERKEKARQEEAKRIYAILCEDGDNHLAEETRPEPRIYLCVGRSRKRVDNFAVQILADQDKIAQWGGTRLYRYWFAP